MTDANTNKSRHATRKRGGRARGQMAGGMLASLSAESAEPKAFTSHHHHHTTGATSSLMNLDQVKHNKAAQRRVPLKEEAMNRQDVKLSSRLRKEQQVEINAAATEHSKFLSTTVAAASPRNSNPVVMSPSSDLPSVADDALTPPPLTSVKIKNHYLESTLLSPISLAGLSPPPAHAPIQSETRVNDEDEMDESYVQSNGGSEENVEYSNSLDENESTMSNESNDATENSEEESISNNTNITNEEIAANPRIVINRKIAKDFHGKTYVGTVVGYDDSEQPAFWQVEYTDGDGEDFSYAELMSAMDYFAELERDDNIPSMDDSDENTSYDQSMCGDDDKNDEAEECFDEEESDDDEDYSIEQESDSEDELEIDEGVDSEVRNGRSRGQKKVGSKVSTKRQNDSDTQSLDECRVDLSAQIEDEDELDDVDNADFEIIENFDHGTDTSDDSKDSDPVAVEVQSEDGVTFDQDAFEGEFVADYVAPVSETTSETDACVEVEEQSSINIDAQSMDEVSDAKGYESPLAKIQEGDGDESSIVQANMEHHRRNKTPEEATLGAVEECTSEQENSTNAVKDVVAQDGVEDEAQEPSTSDLFDVVDRIFLESDKDSVTVKDVKNAVAIHFGLQKVKKEIKQAIKNRLIDLIQGNSHPIGAVKEVVADYSNTNDCGFHEQEEVVAAETESSVESQNVENNVLEVRSPSNCEASFSYDESYVTQKSQTNSVCDNADERMAMPGTIFQNLSPEFSVHSKTHGNESITMNHVSFSPVISTKPKSRSVVVKGKWSLGPEIGVGSFGRVHTGLNAVNGSIMAVKVLNIPSDNEQSAIEEFQREIDVMKTLNHPNIVRYLGAEFDSSRNTLCIFQEWIPGGSVSSLLKRFGPFSIDLVKTYAQQVLKGLDYLHSHGIIHRDIKGGNILVSNDGSIKLADFGASKKVEALGSESSDRMEMTMRGTPYFMAPEVFDENYGRKADIWSVGGVIYQMATGLPPWKSLGLKNPLELIRHISNHSNPPTLPPMNYCDGNDLVLLKNILSRCFERDPSNRPFASELLLDAFFGTTNESKASTPSPKLPLLSPSIKSPLHRIVENQELGSNLPDSPLCYSLQRVPEDGPSDVSSSDSLCYSLTLTSPLKINRTSNGVIDSSEWPEWAKNRHFEKENVFSSKPKTRESKGNPFAKKKKPLANLSLNATYSPGAAK